jgi:hypothetical protein
MKARRLIPNPLLKRIEFIESQYAKRPEIGAALRSATKRAIGKDEIDPNLSTKWERNLGWAAKAMNDLGKKKDAGEISESAYRDQIKKISGSFRTAIDPFLEKEIRPKFGEPFKYPGISTESKVKLKKGTGLIERRGIPLESLSPKQARQLAARRGKEIARLRRDKKELNSERLAFIKSIGAELFHNFGDGYLALKSPKATEDLPRNITKEWVQDHARFQNWLGETMRNCLQFFHATYGAAYGASKYEIIREGGVLYGIIDDKNKPVAALFFNRDGELIESNGIDNIPPGPEYNKYLEETELYLKNISMWEIIYFYYINYYLSLIINKINNTDKKIFYVINQINDAINTILTNIIYKYKKNAILIDFEKKNDQIKFFKINQNFNSNSELRTEIDLNYYVKN